ncbi:uncharacterized protein BKA78DRAFT_307935 [Phyllosticta capitalensis]|uniref:uncharacterized protein n=1 Tax=Phyllosticta capitalensis TaxID=121624 RepID=UPI00313123E6
MVAPSHRQQLDPDGLQVEELRLRSGVHTGFLDSPSWSAPCFRKVSTSKNKARPARANTIVVPSHGQQLDPDGLQVEEQRSAHLRYLPVATRPSTSTFLRDRSRASCSRREGAECALQAIRKGCANHLHVLTRSDASFILPMGLRNVPLHACLSSPWMLRDDEHLSRPIISVLLPHLHLTSVPQLVISSPQRPTSPAVDASDLGASNATLLARATQGSAQLHRHESIPHHGLSRSPPNRFRPPMPLGEQSGGSHRAKGGPSSGSSRER